MTRITEADFLPPPVEKAKETPRILIIDNSRDFTHSGNFIPRDRVIYHWFDAYDLEEERFRKTQQQRKEIV
jgi:hypothetical protein